MESASVDVTKDGVPFRFATTHLAADSGAVQVAQAQEFLEGPAATARPMISVGHLNSDADATTITGVVPNTRDLRRHHCGRVPRQLGGDATGRPRLHVLRGGEPSQPTPTLNQRIDYVLTRGAINPLFDFPVGNTVLDQLLYG